MRRPTEIYFLRVIRRPIAMRQIYALREQSALYDVHSSMRNYYKLCTSFHLGLSSGQSRCLAGN